MSIALFIIAVIFLAYTLFRVEFEKHELKREMAGLKGENRALTLALAKRSAPQAFAPHQPHPEADSMGTGAAQTAQRGRPGRFKSFGNSKKESGEYEPTPEELKRSVNV